MSIKAMTWAFALPLEPRAKLTLLSIADNARDDGIAWPSRETIAEKTSQSRSTVNRRVKTLAALGVIAIKERFREDGTQTTDEIHLDLSLSPADVLRKMHDAGEDTGGDGDEETGSGGSVDDAARRDVDGAGAPGADDAGASPRGYQPDTLGVQSGHPGGAVVTGGGMQSGHPQDEPSLEQESPPNPPPGGPLSKGDKDAEGKRALLWDRFAASYPGIGRMDQQAAKGEFDQLSIDAAEWAVGSLVQLKVDLARDKVAGKAAHLWLRKEMFKNYPRVKVEPPPPDEVWIADGSDEDRALRFVRNLACTPWPRVRAGPDGLRGYPHKTVVGADLLAMLAFVNEVHLRWTGYPRGSPEFAAWQARFKQWVGGARPTEPGSDCIRVPCQWPPKKDGTLYLPDEPPEANQEPAS